MSEKLGIDGVDVACLEIGCFVIVLLQVAMLVLVAVALMGR